MQDRNDAEVIVRYLRMLKGDGPNFIIPKGFMSQVTFYFDAEREFARFMLEEMISINGPMRFVEEGSYKGVAMRLIEPVDEYMKLATLTGFGLYRRDKGSLMVAKGERIIECVYDCNDVISSTTCKRREIRACQSSMDEACEAEKD